MLRRISGWLRAGGAAYLGVFTPWRWADRAGQVRHWEQPTGLMQTSGFDAGGCRMTDTSDDRHCAPADEAA